MKKRVLLGMVMGLGFCGVSYGAAEPLTRKKREEVARRVRDGVESHQWLEAARQEANQRWLENQRAEEQEKRATKNKEMDAKRVADQRARAEQRVRDAESATRKRGQAALDDLVGEFYAQPKAHPAAAARQSLVEEEWDVLSGDDYGQASVSDDNKQPSLSARLSGWWYGN